MPGTFSDVYGIRGITFDAYPNGERLWDSDSDLMFKTFVAQPVFADGFETGDTTVWSMPSP